MSFHRPTMARMAALAAMQVAQSSLYASAVSAQMTFKNAGQVFNAIEREVDGKKVKVSCRQYTDRSEFMPHQGKKEMARRVRQMAKAAG